MDSFNLRASIPSNNLNKDAQFLIQLFDLELILESSDQVVLSRNNSEFALYSSDVVTGDAIRFCLSSSEFKFEDLIKRYQFVCYANNIIPDFSVDEDSQTLTLKDYLSRVWEVHFQKSLQ